MKKHGIVKSNYGIRRLLPTLAYSFVFCFIIVLSINTFGKGALSYVNLMFLNTKPNFTHVYPNLFDPEEGRNEVVVENNTVKLSTLQFPIFGSIFGEVIIESADINVPLVFGDNVQALRRGAGLYNGSYLPGYGKMSLIAAHNRTFFKNLGAVEVGDTVKINTHYGKYVYEVKSIEIYPMSDNSAYDLTLEDNSLTLYTCYPFEGVSRKTRRIYLYCDFVSGPMIDLNS